MKIAILALSFALLIGCASQAPREVLRQCQWEVASFNIDERSSTALRGTAKVRFTNPTKQKAILDSLWLDVLTPKGALARVSHGRTMVLRPGKVDSAEIHLQADPAQLGMRMMEMLFAMPDSLQIKGSARIPLMWGLFHTTRPFQIKVPGQAVMGALGSAMRGGTSQAPSDTADLDGPLE
ncbi:MAG: hypothetical protein RL318_95 [Fibrobacterota bacterium]